MSGGISPPPEPVQTDGSGWHPWRLFAWLCVAASCGVSLCSAVYMTHWALQLPAAISIIATECTKTVLLDELWDGARRRVVSWVGLVASYAFCVAVSIAAVHYLALNVISDLATPVREQTRLAGAQRGFDDRLRELDALEAAIRRRITPGLDEATAYRRRLDCMNKVDKSCPQDTYKSTAAVKRDVAEIRDLLEKAEENARASVELGVVATKRTQLNAERSLNAQQLNALNASVQSVHGVLNAQNALMTAALVLTLALELGVNAGIRRDRRDRRRVPACVHGAQGVQNVLNAGVQHAPVNVQAHGAHAGNNVRADMDRFEGWLRDEWLRSRDSHGWLTGTQRTWARRAGMSGSGFVHAALEDLEKRGVIEKRVTSRRTMLRFRGLVAFRRVV